MGQETGLPREKNPVKVLAGQKGGFAKARNQKSSLSDSNTPFSPEKNKKRKVDSACVILTRHVSNALCA